MKLADIPVKVPVPFATNADGSFIAVIPQTTGVPGRASWTIGLPPVTMEPIGSGGVPPFGQDFNGLFNAISAWTRWQGAGAQVAWDSTFSAEISGYPQGACVTAANGLGWWVSQIDDNTTDPDASGAGWLFVPIEQVYDGDPNGNVAGQAASATAPASTTWDRSTMTLWVCTVSGIAAVAEWRPLPLLTQIAYVTGPSRNFVAADIGIVTIRDNGGGADMADTLPDGTVGDGWNTTIINSDAVAKVTITAPGTRSLNGVLNGTVELLQDQNVTIAADVNGDFWKTVVPIPRVFSAQAVYVATSGLLVPGVYDIDTTGGAITIQLEAAVVLGDNYLFRDVGGALGANPCTIDANGKTIEGAATFILDVPWSEVVITQKSNIWSLT